MQSTPSEALLAVHADLEEVTKTGLKQTLAKAVQALAKKEALPVESIAQFKDACLAGAKLFGWDGKPETQINVGVGVGLVCTEEQRQALIALREKITGAKVVYPQASAEVVIPQHVAASQIQVQSSNDATSGERPGAPWGLPAGATAPTDAGPAFKAWAEYEKAEPE